LLREEVPIFPFENAGDLHDRLMVHGARLVIKTISKITGDNIKPLPQNNMEGRNKYARLAPKIHPEDCIIDWNSGTEKIHNMVRGLSPYPCARSWFKNNTTTISFKVFESEPEFESHNFRPGTIFSDGKLFLKISSTDGYLYIKCLQLEGKKRLGIVDFLRGFRITDFIIPVIEKV
jgi:methionyl-tRNA formyltransferase